MVYVDILLDCKYCLCFSDHRQHHHFIFNVVVVKQRGAAAARRALLLDILRHLRRLLGLPQVHYYLFGILHILLKWRVGSLRLLLTQHSDLVYAS